MKRTLAILGMFLLLVPHLVQASIYETILNQERQHALLETGEPVVRLFAAGILASRAPFDNWQMSPADINLLLRGDRGAACAAQCSGESGTTSCSSGGSVTRRALGDAECEELVSDVEQLTQREGEVRASGRRLHRLAAGQEVLLGDPTNTSNSLALHFETVISLWVPGTGSSLTGQRRRFRVMSAKDLLTKTLSEERLKEMIDDVDAKLTNLKAGVQTDEAPSEIHRTIYDRVTAAAWRYRGGVRLVSGARAPTYPAPDAYRSETNLERQYLFMRWEDLEQALMRLWNSLPQNPTDYSPALIEDEIVLITFAGKDTSLTQNPDVAIWARMDGNTEENHPEADIGLFVELPTEPVLPSLLSANAVSCLSSCGGSNSCEQQCLAQSSALVLGGTYPPEPTDEAGRPAPADGRVLCSDPIAQEGYLCSPVPSNATSSCKESVSTQNGAIVLTRCTASTASGRTVAGADACEPVRWRDDVFDPTYDCRVSVTCQADCGEGMEERVEQKTADGRVSVCISDPSKTGAAPATYRIIGRLAQANLPCGREAGWSPYDGVDDPDRKREICCRMEGEVNAVACQAMAEDGVFSDENGLPLTASGSIPFSAQTCAEALTDQSCDKLQNVGRCPTSWDYPEEFVQTLNTFVGQRAPASVARSCTQALKNPDPRITAAVKALQRDDRVCTPNRTVRYRNSIGNNVCYAAQCAEQSLETHRLAPGRMPLAVNDGAFPTDDRLGVTGNTWDTAPIESMAGRIPAYEPQRLFLSLEAALCQSSGLPPLSPGVACRYNLRLADLQGPRFALTPPSTGLDQGTDIRDAGSISLLPAAGVRAGAFLQAEYLRGVLDPLTSLLQAAERLLSNIRSTTPPSTMCPLGPS
ncbi:MAG: hypothetical protein G01um101425_169 [Candidatus Peregrinibacteria bacterium Gr01-1014_25]|nr:MAG: hypothetical protein G01um101425_169 [Candidatus Peregrinibacteria bacterium Gr01-1014_25]